nr:unnamed protein product [Digitaria exilis]
MTGRPHRLLAPRVIGGYAPGRRGSFLSPALPARLSLPPPLFPLPFLSSPFPSQTTARPGQACPSSSPRVQKSIMKGAKSKGAAKADAKLAVKSKGAEKPAKGRKGKAGKDPNKPKRAPSAFFVFMDEFRKEFKEKNPKNKSVAAVGKAAGDRWKSLSEADKAPYVAKANKLKIEYNKAIAAYNKGESTAAKKAPAKEEEEEDEEESDKSKSEVNDEDDDEGSEEEEDDDE